ncbi:MICAL-like protein 1 isoform X2 [Plectropomus leopardus]|uniref:MICAL-like protein 1 isoform X2 n=1 Tax=Plectropomus leopardus TaxID=160734 RepID=UPI001C4D3864|nr:MICAL-like protein 1 isoform X2 [Plectropomus leopardus]
MSNVTQEMASLKTIRDWCRVTCASYPNVEIKNMSTSFRDGLAFCAIIHKHRPDLIDFRSLSKDNVYQNNKLAFEIAERELGIPALLDPKDMDSTKVPDCLSVITYLSQYYYYFNRKTYGLASWKSSHVAFINNLTKIKSPDGLNPLRSPTHLETSREDRLSNTRPRTVCSLCFKPVHLIQRRLIDGKFYHRSCFRCKACGSALLPGSYTQGSDRSSLICTHHKTDSETHRVDLTQQVRSAENRPDCNFQADFYTLSGLAVTSVPHYTKKTESQDRLVCKTIETEREEKQETSKEVKDGENRDSAVGLKVKKPLRAHLPPPRVEEVKGGGKSGSEPTVTESNKQQEATKCQETSELPSPCKVTEGNSRPVPAPRRNFNSSAAPVPAPRNKTTQPMNRSAAAGYSSNRNKCSPNSSRITSPTRGSSRVQSNHPWMTLIHPGPWTQLPPAPPPVPFPRTKSISKQREAWNRPRVAPNPFAEEVDESIEEDTKPKPEPAGNGDTDITVCSIDAENIAVISISEENVGASSEPAEDTSSVSALEETGSSLPDVTDAAAAAAAAAAAGLHAISIESQSRILPRSVSVPAITSANESDQVMSSQSKLACKENPFDRKPRMLKSKSVQALPSTRAPAPGHGFPLIKRKVQSDQNVSTEDLQVEIRELDKRLEALEQRGVELEGKLRDDKNDEEEEQMLMEWFSLIHERHILVGRETELVYLTKQQKLEERQADVEFELRCLLNKPENDWTEEDRAREQQMMSELVDIIEQRNQIVGSLDQDRQREREEDKLLEAMMKNKEFQKEGLKDLKKSKGKFRATKMFKLLNQKAESTKDSLDKKN